MRSLVGRSCRLEASSLLVSPPSLFQPSPDRDVVYTARYPHDEFSSRLASSRSVSFHQSFQPNSNSSSRTFERRIVNTVNSLIQTDHMDVKGGGGGGGSTKTDKKRGPVTALLSRQNSKSVRGSTPVNNSDQESSPPILTDGNNDGPFAGKRTPSIKSKQGEPSADRNKSPSPKNVDQQPTPTRERSESGQGDALLSASDSTNLINKVNGRRMIDSAKKKILWLASKAEWGSLEQALKTLDNALAAQKGSPEPSPLAGIQDEVTFSFYRIIFKFLLI